ncbi:hypothetical protein LSH36_353g08103 [Paralvinella palmiformis]|uniref:Zinc finger protein 830 n=1 Tax=Paralvinella palmiformis TaxID=53620 RepID=A0AAD9JF21_9ANNE|nr:hypothetical protein LSH36_353g08103 [Paralvinella palmiformis]
MASSKKKTVISKDDLRRLMKEKQTSLKSEKKRIDSPLARYNSLGQLSCVLCNTPVKTELLWNAHVIGRTHKENLARLKEQKEQAMVPSPEERKRKLADEEILAISKGLKYIINCYIFYIYSSVEISSDTNESQQVKPRSILKTSATYQQQQQPASDPVCGEIDHNLTDIDCKDNNVNRTTGTTKTNPESNLPPDFFESGVDADVPPGDGTDKSPAELSEKLPEGFFDDPKQDAKTSEAIQAEDDEEANEERHLMEVEEQLKKWSKIDELAKMKERLIAQEKQSTENDNSEDESVDEEEFDEFLDWRSKKAWK